MQLHIKLRPNQAQDRFRKTTQKTVEITGDIISQHFHYNQNHHHFHFYKPS